jgi:hypothetical protein
LWIWIKGAAFFVVLEQEGDRRYTTKTSERKIEANRENAQKSTGPRTPEGKAAASRNALRHGLLAQQVLLPGENGEALRKLGEVLRTELQPVGDLENLFVDPPSSSPPVCSDRPSYSPRL